jgi:hypothetical protein
MTNLTPISSAAVFLLSFVLNTTLVVYRMRGGSRVQRIVDRVRNWITGRDDWQWIRLWHVMVPLVVITLVNVAWQVSNVHCADDSLAILASGQAALSGHDPFSVGFCGGLSPDAIPYGLSEVAINALAATSGAVVAIWIAWQLLALAVVPLVWNIGGAERRYLAVLAGTSVLYLPNIATNIGVENAVVPVSVLLMLWALTLRNRRGTWLKGLAAFLSTARFLALFPLLASSSPLKKGRVQQTALVLGVFLGSVILSYLLWGWDAVGIVYLGQFVRVPGESLNLFALLLVQGWVHPSIVVSAIQGGILLSLVIVANYRGYSAEASCGVSLIGVFLLSQYLGYHFLIWILPLILLGSVVNLWLLAFGALAFVDEVFFLSFLGAAEGIWWPYEVTGILLTLILIYLLAIIIREQESRARSTRRVRA